MEREVDDNVLSIRMHLPTKRSISDDDEEIFVLSNFDKLTVEGSPFVSKRISQAMYHERKKADLNPTPYKSISYALNNDTERNQQMKFTSPMKQNLIVIRSSSAINSPSLEDHQENSKRTDLLCAEK